MFPLVIIVAVLFGPTIIARAKGEGVGTAVGTAANKIIDNLIEKATGGSSSSSGNSDGFGTYDPDGVLPFSF